jgi:hypothetical protein
MGEGGARPSGPTRRPATPLASLALGGLAPGRPRRERKVVVMETLAGFPYLPALWLRQAKPAFANASRALRVHDFLGLRLASARSARGAPTHVPSVALPAARAELDLSAA